jgi:Domain of unknown function (DUF4334)
MAEERDQIAAPPAKSGPERWRALRAAAGPVDPRALDALWADLEAVYASSILGSSNHFKRMDDDTLMGVMNGKPSAVPPASHLFYFGLERE